jgi:hypothetical protein
MYTQQITVPLACINKDAAMAIERSHGIESANLNDAPSSPTADTAGDPGGFGIGVFAKLELKIGPCVDPVRLGR